MGRYTRAVVERDEAHDSGVRCVGQRKKRQRLASKERAVKPGCDLRQLQDHMWRGSHRSRLRENTRAHSTLAEHLHNDVVANDRARRWTMRLGSKRAAQSNGGFE